MSKLVVTLTVDDLQTIIRAEVSAALRDRGPSVVNAPAVFPGERQRMAAADVLAVHEQCQRLGDSGDG